MLLILIIITLFSIINTFIGINSEIIVLYSIMSKICLLILYLKNISRNKISLVLPNSLFIFMYFIFVTFGELVWLLRNIYFYNLPGKPDTVSQELLIIFIFLFIINSQINNKFKNLEAKNILNYYELSNRGFYILFSFTILSVFISTNGLKNIPIFSENIIESKSKVSSISGVGFSFVFLLTGVYNFIFTIKKFLKKRTLNLFCLIILLYLPFIFYGGRSLIILPFFFTISLFSAHIQFKPKVIFKLLPFLIISLFLLTYYSLYRNYGKIDLSNFEQINYVVSDTFPEYRTLVNSISVSNNNYGNSFFSNLIYGQIPRFFFDYLGKNKFDYYVSIGHIVTEHTSYYNMFNGGIRLTFIGELLVSDLLYRIISILVIQIILYKGTKEFFLKQNKKSSLNLIMLSYLIVFGFPYGINFIVLSLQFYIFISIINPIIFKFKNPIAISYKNKYLNKSK